jgi:transcriptional regulator with XRE-family HTH domain
MKRLAEMSARRRLRMIRRYEQGKTTPTRTHLIELGAALDVPPWAFLLAGADFERLMAGERPNRAAIDQARAHYAELRP